jgi:hypothetical protein
MSILEKLINLTENYKNAEEKMIKQEFSIESIDNTIEALDEIKKFLYGEDNKL